MPSPALQSKREDSSKNQSLHDLMQMLSLQYMQVDRKSVLEWKLAKLQKAGAAMRAGQSNSAYPLKAASYVPVMAGTGSCAGLMSAFL